VKSLQNQKKKLHEDTEAKKKRKAQVEAGVRQGMQALLILNNEINHKRRVIDTIRQDITTLNANISLLNRQMDTLTQELDDRKQRYMKSMRYLHRNRSIQNQMMFVFSADNFNKMYRRLRFTREYATFQRAQGEAVKQKQEQVTQKRQQLAQAKDRMNTLLSRGQQEQVQLEGKQNEQEKQVATLKKEQLTLATIIEQQQRQERELNTRIDKMIAEEVARAKARAEAEARRKAAAEAAKKRQEELARKRAAAEAARKENERRIAQAKAAEERAKAAAREASRKSAQERAAAERRAQEAEQARKRVEKNAREENTAREREIAQVKKSAEDFTVPAADRMLTGGFEQNRGRLPMPITGAYKIVRTFGSNMVEGLKNVQLESKGIHLKGQSGAQARSVFDGEVSAVFNQGGKYIVMVRHGKYISVYCNLTTVSVSTGQRVAARQMLGSLGSDGIMQFQLRNWTQLLNPMRWLGR
jgi:septal ring factor EnvC (AmiA/AmiB activator)